MASTGSKRALEEGDESTAKVARLVKALDNTVYSDALNEAMMATLTGLMSAEDRATADFFASLSCDPNIIRFSTVFSTTWAPGSVGVTLQRLADSFSRGHGMNMTDATLFPAVAAGAQLFLKGAAFQALQDAFVTSKAIGERDMDHRYKWTRANIQAQITAQLTRAREVADEASFEVAVARVVARVCSRLPSAVSGVKTPSLEDFHRFVSSGAVPPVTQAQAIWALLGGRTPPATLYANKGDAMKLSDKAIAFYVPEALEAIYSCHPDMEVWGREALRSGEVQALEWARRRVGTWRARVQFDDSFAASWSELLELFVAGGADDEGMCVVVRWLMDSIMDAPDQERVVNVLGVYSADCIVYLRQMSQRTGTPWAWSSHHWISVANDVCRDMAYDGITDTPGDVAIWAAKMVQHGCPRPPAADVRAALGAQEAEYWPVLAPFFE